MSKQKPRRLSGALTLELGPTVGGTVLKLEKTLYSPPKSGQFFGFPPQNGNFSDSPPKKISGARPRMLRTDSKYL